jgi:hypothetical protein
VQIIPGTEGQKADTRFEGGFAIYDAPEPWGPWTTVYFTEKWDVGPGETASFPTKWMSGDGKTLYLVFSGDDNFALRKASLTVASAEKSPSPAACRYRSAKSSKFDEQWLGRQGQRDRSAAGGSGPCSTTGFSPSSRHTLSFIPPSPSSSIAARYRPFGVASMLVGKPAGSAIW